MMTRRHALFAGATFGALVLARFVWPHAARAEKAYEVTHTDEEWRHRRTPENGVQQESHARRGEGDLSDNDDSPSVHCIGDRSAQQRAEQKRPELDEANEPDHQGRMGNEIRLVRDGYNG